MRINVKTITGFESKAAFDDMSGAASISQMAPQVPILKVAWIDTPLGTMIAIADDKALYLLEFTNGKGLDREIAQLSSKVSATIIAGSNAPLLTIGQELKSYFSGELKKFKTPLHLFGSSFRQLVWQELLRIPYGKTKSYAQQAQALGKPTAFRAVANANGANQLAIIIPCHRIINHNGKLGGYGGGFYRKKWLLAHEQNPIQ